MTLSFISVLVLAAFATGVYAQKPVDVPHGNAAVIDGTIENAEWAD